MSTDYIYVNLDDELQTIADRPQTDYEYLIVSAASHRAHSETELMYEMLSIAQKLRSLNELIRIRD